MYKVVKEFRDKTNRQHKFKIGDGFVSTDTDRIQNLLQRGLIAKVETKASKPKK